MKASPSPSFSASTHQRCQRKLCRRRVPKSEILQVRQRAQPLDLAPHLGLGAGIEHVELERAEALQGGARAQLVDDRERGNFPHRGVGPGPVEIEHRYWPSRLRSSYSGSRKSSSQRRNSGSKICLLP